MSKLKWSKKSLIRFLVCTLAVTTSVIIGTTAIVIFLLNKCFFSSHFNVVGCKADTDFYAVTELNSNEMMPLSFDHTKLSQIAPSDEQAEFTHLIMISGKDQLGGRISAFWTSNPIADFDTQLCPKNGGAYMIAFQINHITIPSENGYIELKPVYYDDNGDAVDHTTYSGLKIGGTFGSYAYSYDDDFS